MSDDASLSFDQARSDEQQLVFDILDEAARWLDRRNISEWPAQFSDMSDWRSERIAAHIEADHTWLVRTDGEAIAPITRASGTRRIVLARARIRRLFFLIWL